jgi:hypothetical protein
MPGDRGRATIELVASILAGTADGLWRLDAAGGGRVPALEGREVGALAPDSWERLWAIVDGAEVWRTGADGGWAPVASLAGSGLDGLRAHCLADTRANALGAILVGTSRARLLRVDGSGSVEPVAAFDEAPGRARWSTPWGDPPDVRTITEDRENVFVNVHVGGVLRSRDEGCSWQPTIQVGADVHRVVTGHGRVYAAGAHGLSVSEDAGETWRLVDAGLHAAYCRSVAVCGDAVLVSASTGPAGRRSAVYRTDAAARLFERSRNGLPEWFERNVDSLCLDALPDGSLAAFGTEEGDVYTSRDAGASWERAAAELGAVRCVLTLP